jgi:tryptophanyl-tRNA synthetase
MSLSKEKELELRKELTRDIDSCVDAILKTKPSFENRESIHESLRGLFAEVIDYRIRMNSNSSVGIFNYPVLMAADILLYGARYVPVGDDQTQHLEYTRDIAERMNARFGELFIVPEPVKKQHEFFGKDQGLRVMDLADPTKKMSKSDDSGKGVIFLSDAPEAAAKKVMSATTDSVGAVHYDPSNQPGISNLLEIHALLSGESLKKVIEHHQGETNYGALKMEIAEQVRDFLTDFQDGLARPK